MLLFEWDPNKATENLETHGVSFDHDSTAFRETLSLTTYDPLPSRDQRLVSHVICAKLSLMQINKKVLSLDYFWQGALTAIPRMPTIFISKVITLIPNFGLLERLFEVPAVKAVFLGVKEDVFGYEVLIEAGVELFEKIGASRFQDPGNLAEGGLPIRDVVQDAEAEYRIKRCVSIRQIQNIGG